MNAIDTNIFLYSVDRNEPTKQRRAQELLEHLQTNVEPTILLWQVLGELGQQLRRWRDKGKLTHTEFGQHIQTFRHLFPLVLPTPEVFEIALDL
jgi:predicted nucleic acid-binding protein